MSISLKWHILIVSPLFEKEHTSPWFELNITKTQYQSQSFNLISRLLNCKVSDLKISKIQLCKSTNSNRFKLLTVETLNCRNRKNNNRTFNISNIPFWTIWILQLLGPNLLLGRTSFSANLLLGAYCKLIFHERVSEQFREQKHLFFHAYSSYNLFFSTDI